MNNIINSGLNETSRLKDKLLISLKKKKKKKKKKKTFYRGKQC